MAFASANHRFKSGYRQRLEGGFVTSVAILLTMIWLVPPRGATFTRTAPLSSLPTILSQLEDPPPEIRIIDPDPVTRPTLPELTAIPLPPEIAVTPLPAPDPPELLAGSPVRSGPGFYQHWDSAPRILKTTEPVYPTIAREAGAEGAVLVEVTIGPDGLVRAARVVRSNTVGSLEEAARRAALQWIFRPATMNDHPVACRLRIPFRFSLGR